MAEAGEANASAPDEGKENRYRVLFELGSGGTSRIHLALCWGSGGLSRLVVLKTLKSEFRDDPDLQRMFRTEARMLARLNHDNIVHVHEVFEHEGAPVIAMQYLDGVTLSGLTSKVRSSLPLAFQLRVLFELLEGLQYVHELKDFDGSPLELVHRDVSPHNVFITYDGSIKLVDFGIAKSGASSFQTDSGLVKGKLRYMPPEQIRGEALDRRADIYAVGAILWEFIAGQRLWHQRSDVEVLNGVLHEAIPSPSEVRATGDPELVRICMKALSKDRAQRYETAHDMQSDIEAYMAARGFGMTGKQIGKVVRDAFPGEREQKARRISRLLKGEREIRESSTERVTFSPIAEGSSDDSSSGSRTISRKGTSLWLIATGVFVAIGAGALFLRSAPESPPAKSSTQIKKVVSIRIAATPSAATVSLDGSGLPENPFSTTMSADGAWHVARASAPGYSSQQQGFRLTSDVDLVFVLEPIPPAPSAPRGEPNTLPGARSDQVDEEANRPKQPVVSPPRPAPKSKVPDCDPPYVIGADGIRRLKTECL